MQERGYRRSGREADAKNHDKHRGEGYVALSGEAEIELHEVFSVTLGNRRRIGLLTRLTLRDVGGRRRRGDKMSFS